MVNLSYISQAADTQSILIAEMDETVVGVAQVDRTGADPVIYKLYVHPDCRGRGIGPLMISAIIDQLPADAERLRVEQLAANTRAGQFYQREGFVIDHIEPGVGDDPGMSQVWYSRRLIRR